MLHTKIDWSSEVVVALIPSSQDIVSQLKEIQLTCSSDMARTPVSIILALDPLARILI